MASDAGTEIELVVVESKISMGGVARVHTHVIDHLHIRTGDTIVVRKGDKSIIVKVFGDNIIDEGEISLRVKDRRRLGVREGDYVTVSPYENVKDVLSRRFRWWRR